MMESETTIAEANSPRRNEILAKNNIQLWKEIQLLAKIKYEN